MSTVAPFDVAGLRQWVEYLERPVLSEAVLRQLLRDLLAAADFIERVLTERDAGGVEGASGETAGNDNGVAGQVVGLAASRSVSAWAGVYPRMCVDPETCRGYTSCPRSYSCSE